MTTKIRTGKIIFDNSGISMIAKYFNLNIGSKIYHFE